MEENQVEKLKAKFKKEVKEYQDRIKILTDLINEDDEIVKVRYPKLLKENRVLRKENEEIKKLEEEIASLKHELEKQKKLRSEDGNKKREEVLGALVLAHIEEKNRLIEENNNLRKKLQDFGVRC